MWHISPHAARHAALPGAGCEPPSRRWMCCASIFWTRGSRSRSSIVESPAETAGSVPRDGPTASLAMAGRASPPGDALRSCHRARARSTRRSVRAPRSLMPDPGEVPCGPCMVHCAYVVHKTKELDAMPELSPADRERLLAELEENALEWAGTEAAERTVCAACRAADDCRAARVSSMTLLRGSARLPWLELCARAGSVTCRTAEAPPSMSMTAHMSRRLTLSPTKSRRRPRSSSRARPAPTWPKAQHAGASRQLQLPPSKPPSPSAARQRAASQASGGMVSAREPGGRGRVTCFTLVRSVNGPDMATASRRR